MKDFEKWRSFSFSQPTNFLTHRHFQDLNIISMGPGGMKKGGFIS